MDTVFDIACFIAFEMKLDLQYIIWDIKLPELCKILHAIKKKNSQKPMMSRTDMIINKALYEAIEERINGKK